MMSWGINFPLRTSMWSWCVCLPCRGHSTLSSWTASERQGTPAGSASTPWKLFVSAARSVCVQNVAYPLQYYTFIHLEPIILVFFTSKCILLLFLRFGIIQTCYTKLCRKKTWQVSRIWTLTTSHPLHRADVWQQHRLQSQRVWTTQIQSVDWVWTSCRKKPIRSSHMSGYVLVWGFLTLDLKNRLCDNSSNGISFTPSHGQAKELMCDYKPGILENSAKMVLLFHLIEESVRKGDKILVFRWKIKIKQICFL